MNMKDKNKIKEDIPLVVLFGRTNVGKSTLFNCLREKKQAFVANIAGTTRDSNIGKIEWQGKAFNLVDTGGIIDLNKLFVHRKTLDKTIDSKVQKQVSEYLLKADLILFVVDGKDGLLADDKEAVSMLKKVLKERGKNNKKIILVVNKVEKAEERLRAAEFYKLSLGDTILVSAVTGSGTGDLLDKICELDIFGEKSKKINSTSCDKELINICILGQPNVGKSSLLNQIIGEERVIVSETPHTTREPQDSYLKYKNHSIRIIDTAGLSKKHHRLTKTLKKKEKGTILEVEGISQSLGVLKKSDIALFVWDASEDITVEDLKIIEEIVKSKKSLIIVTNKWDLIEEKDVKKYTSYIRSKIPFVAWAPIIFISAQTGEKITKLMDLILDVDKNRKIELSNSQLQKFLSRVVKIHRPSRGKGFRHPRIYELSQSGVNPPEFKVRIGKRDDIHFSYLRFLENRLREKFGFLGSSITIWVDRGKKKVN